VSPEELRWANMCTTKAGRAAGQLITEFNQAVSAKDREVEELLRAPRPPSLGGPAIHSTYTGILAASSGGPLAPPAPSTAGVFGRPPAGGPVGHPFGGGGVGHPFGRSAEPVAAQQSPFSTGGTPGGGAFGGAAAGAAGAFGRPPPSGAASSFGGFGSRASSPAAASPFGQANHAAPSPFGQANQEAPSPFGTNQAAASPLRSQAGTGFASSPAAPSPFSSGAQQPSCGFSLPQSTPASLALGAGFGTATGGAVPGGASVPAAQVRTTDSLALGFLAVPLPPTLLFLQIPSPSAPF